MFNLSLRANTFNEIYGHKTMLNELKNRSKDISFPTYALFEGLSGSGKTTTILIITKLLNCLNPVKNSDGYFEPCNCCDSCNDINDSKFSRDVLYIDANDLNKESVLDLNNKLYSMPMFDKNKIIIVDEAHRIMENSKARDSFLTLLEKPRKNSYVFFATTDSAKFDMAILRRLQRYKFKEIPDNELFDYLISILDKSGNFDNVPKEFLEKGLYTIVDNSSGSPGIAINYLERCIQGGLFTYEKIIEELGLLDKEYEYELVNKLLMKDKTLFKSLIETKIDLKEFYFKSRKILNDLCIYKISKYVDTEWKENRCKALEKYSDNAISLLSYYEDINSFYFDKTNYITKLLFYFGNGLIESYDKEVNNDKQIRVRVKK